MKDAKFYFNVDAAYIEQNDDEYMVYIERDGMIHVLNDTAGTIVTWLKEEPSTADSLSAKLSSFYPDVATEEINADINEILDSLVQLGVIICQSSQIA